MRIFILGANGLLGRYIVAEAKNKDLDVAPISRESMPDIEKQLTNPIGFVRNLQIQPADYVINALGVTRHRIERGDPGADLDSVDRINNQLPHALGEGASGTGFKVIQIGTDCVFSGHRGDYLEHDEYDATDVYGRSKALGESATGITVVRASFVGPSGHQTPYLWDWVEHQKPGAKLSGFSNVFWNGVTASVHAAISVGIASNSFPIEGTQHLVPANQVSKGELVQLIAKSSGREDLAITPTEVSEPKNLTLATNNEALNRDLWSLAGYRSTPSIEQLFDQNLGSI